MSLAEIAYIHRPANLGEKQTRIKLSEIYHYSANIINKIRAAEKSILPGNISDN